MQELQIRTYMVLEQMWGRMVDSLRNEEGQTAAEYVGILAFVAAVVGIILAARTEIGNALLGKIRTTISQITGG